MLETEPILLNLSSDAKTKACKNIASILDAMKFLRELIITDDVTTENRYNNICVSQSSLEDLKHVLGYKSDQEKEDELKKNLLRQANIRIVELEKQLAERADISVISPKMQELYKTIGNWWSNLGFGLIKGHYSCEYQPHFEIKFSVHFGIDSIYSSSDKNKKIEERNQKLLESLQHVGSVKSDVKILDTPDNRSWFQKELTVKFPNCLITELKSVIDYKSNNLVIREITVNIPIFDIGPPIKRDFVDYE